MAFKSIGQRMGFVSIADAERMAKASGRRKGLAEGRKEGLAEGRAEGRKEGLAEGLAEGRAEGIQQEQANSEKKFALWAKRVAKKTGLSQEELLALKP